MPLYNTASIGRATNGPFKDVAFSSGETVRDLLRKASISLESGEEVNDEYGNPVSLSATPNNKATYYVVKNLKNGFE